MQRKFLISSFQHYVDALCSFCGLKMFLSFLFSVFIYFFGKVNDAVIALFCLMVIDTCFGFVRALCEKRLSSYKLRQGIIKFFLYFIFILSANCLDLALSGSSVFSKFIPFSVRAFSLSYLSLTESISILEHLSACGIPVPNVLFDVYKHFNRKSKKEQ